MPCLRPKTIKNPRYKEGGWQKRQIYCRDYFGYNNSILKKEPDGSFSWYPPDYYISVPCGRCVECRRKSRNAWAFRLMTEVNAFKSSHCTFITLTLDNEHLNKFKDDPKTPLKLYIDRLRKHLGYRPRYFFVSELGEENDRLHYHGILFGTPPKSLPYEIQRKKWNYGFAWTGWCDYKTCNYIVKYMLKYKGSYKPFIMCSNGIGASYLDNGVFEKHLNNFDPKLVVKKNGYYYPLHRYYVNKLFNDELKAIFLVNRLNDSTPFERKFRGTTFTDEFTYQNALDQFYTWSLSLGLSVEEDKPLHCLKNFNPFNENIEYGTICFSQSRACRYTAKQARLEFV